MLILAYGQKILQRNSSEQRPSLSLGYRRVPPSSCDTILDRLCRPCAVGATFRTMWFTDANPARCDARAQLPCRRQAGGKSGRSVYAVALCRWFIHNQNAIVVFKYRMLIQFTPVGPTFHGQLMQNQSNVSAAFWPFVVSGHATG